MAEDDPRRVFHDLLKQTRKHGFDIEDPSIRYTTTPLAAARSTFHMWLYIPSKYGDITPGGVDSLRATISRIRDELLKLHSKRNGKNCVYSLSFTFYEDEHKGLLVIKARWHGDPVPDVENAIPIYF